MVEGNSNYRGWWPAADSSISSWSMTTDTGSFISRRTSSIAEHSFPNPFSINDLASFEHIKEQESDQRPPAEETCRDDTQLPPADRGRKAWLVLIGASMIEGFMWGELDLPDGFFSSNGTSSDNFTGFPLCFGVFQTYYQSHPPFEGNQFIPVVGTLTNVS